MPRQYSEQQAEFVRNFLITFNIGKAKAAAGYAPGAPSPLRIPAVQHMLAAEMQRRAQATGVTSENVLLELGRLAFSNIKNYFDENENLKPFSAMSYAEAAAIQAVDITETTTGEGDDRKTVRRTKIKFWPKDKSLGMLAQHLGMMPTRAELSGPDGGPIEMEQRRTVVYLPDNGRGDSSMPVQESDE